MQLQLEHHQLLYSIILEVGLPSTTEAWARVISRLPPREDGRATIAQAAPNRYTTLKKRWDQAKIFGETHDEFLEKANKPQKAGKQAKKRVLKEVEEEEENFDQMVEDGENNAKRLKMEEKVVVNELSGDTEDVEESDSTLGVHGEDSPGASPRKTRLKAEDLEEPDAKKHVKKKVTFQVPEEYSSVMSEIDVEV